MAILAPLPVVIPNPNLDLSKVETRTLGFRTLDGMDLLPFQGREFAGLDGIEGFDLPPVEVIEEDQYGDEGTRLIEMRYKPRDLFVPLWLRSDSSHLDYLRNKRARLIELFDFALVDYEVQNGTFDLVANSVDGNNERTLRCHYVSGMEGNLSRTTERAVWSKLGLKLRAAKPFWQGGEWKTPAIRIPSGASFFAEFPAQLSSARALGSDIIVTIPGNADSWPRVVAQGPAPEIEVVGPGLYVRVPDGLADGELMVVETKPGARTATFNGVENWTRVAPQRQFSRLPPGDNVFNLYLGAAGPSAFMYVAGTSQWKTPW